MLTVNLSKVHYLTALVAFVLSIVYSLVLHVDVAQGHNLESLGLRVIAQYTIASALMLVIWQGLPQASSGFSPTFYLLLTGVFVRLILTFVDPYTSNDVTRYLFDGRIALEGFDPYQVPHNANELASLREQWNPPAEHAKYATLYPPLALSFFSFAASFGPIAATWVWQALTALASVAVLLLGYKVLQRQDKLQHLPLLALSPLLILEAGEGLHLDIITALAVLAAVYFWQSKQLLLVGLCIAVGGLLKILPMVLLLPLFIMLTRWQDRFILVVTAVGVWLGGYVLGFYLGFRPIGSLAIFFEKWRSGSALFLWVEPHVSSITMLVIALLLMLLGFLSIAAYLWRSKLTCSNHEHLNLDDKLFLSMQLMMAFPLMISPVIFPWYLLPLMALLALRPNLLVIAWSLSIPLLYEVLGQFACCDNWAPADWPIHIIGLSLIVAAITPFIATRLTQRIASADIAG